MKNYDYWKKSQITDISTFCYWLHQKGVGIYDVEYFIPRIAPPVSILLLLYFKKNNTKNIDDTSLLIQK